jgi:hypothetical protein
MADVTVKIITPAEEHALITIDELKTALGVTTSTPATDAQWSWLIDINSAAIVGLLNRSLAYEEVQETWRGVQNGERVYLSHFPVKADDIESVTTAGNVMLAYELEEDSGKLQIFTGYQEDVVVTYSGGYNLPDEAPMDLKQCIVLMAATWKAQLAMVQVTGVRMISHKESRVMFHTPTNTASAPGSGSSAGVPSAVEAILEGYTRYWV